MQNKKPRQDRRSFMKVAGGVSIAGLMAGCLGDDDSGNGDDDSENGGLDFPEQDITIVVPRSAGGGYDAYGRLAAAQLSESLPVNVEVQNVEGAGGQVGAEQVYNADPDGYTWIMWDSMGTARLQLLDDVGYDYQEMTYIAQATQDTQGIGVTPDTGIETIEEFRDAVQDGELMFGAQGPITDGTLNPILLGLQTGWYEPEAVIDNTVIYDGTSQIIDGMISGDVQVIGTNFYTFPGMDPDDVRGLLALRTLDSIGELDFIEDDDLPYAETLTSADVPGADEIEAMTANVRVFAGPPDVPEDITQYMADAFEDALTSDALLAEAQASERPIEFANREQTEENALAAFELWEENLDLLRDLEEQF